MSLIAGAIAAGKAALGAEASRRAGGFVSKLFGNEGPNVARSLSKQVGCTILQKDAPAARSMLNRGVNPCTGRPQSGAARTGRVSAPVAAPVTRAIQGIIGRGIANIFQGKSPLEQRLTGTEIENIINRPAVGTAPPPRGGITPGQLGFPVPTKKTGFVPPSGGGRMSLIPAAGMSGLPAVIARGGGLARTATGRIGRIFLPSGAAVSKRDAASLIRRVGFEAAAIALGITALEAAELFLQETARRRRGRGITAAQVRNARRTTCMVARLARDLGIKAAPVRRRKTCRS